MSSDKLLGASSIRKIYEESGFISKCIDGFLKEPFWFEDSNGVSLMGDECRPKEKTFLPIYFGKTLPALGFHTLYHNNELVCVQVRDGLARIVDHTVIKDFLRVLCSCIPEIGEDLLDLMTMHHSDFFGKNILTSLRLLDNLTPLVDTRKTAYRPYLNGIAVCTAGSTPKVMSYADIPSGSFVWAHDIINRSIDPDLISDSVSIFDDISDVAGHHFHKFTQNLCKDQTPDGSWELNLPDYKSLVTGWGMVNHRFHGEAGKIVIAIDKHLVRDTRNGRTGKSILMSYACKASMPTAVEIGGDVITGATNFIFNGVGKNCQYVCIDETNPKFPWNKLFGSITSSMTIDNKYGEKFTLGKNVKPKLGMTTNTPIGGDGFSDLDRQHLIPAGNFYQFHKMHFNKDVHQIHGGWFFSEEWGKKNWNEFDSFVIKSIQAYLDMGLVGGKPSQSYLHTKLIQRVGNGELVSVLHRLLEENTGGELYQKAIPGMSDEQRDRCLDFVASQEIAGVKFSLNQLKSSLDLVAAHFGFKINVGHPPDKTRPQLRIKHGGKIGGTNRYVITSSKCPFPSKNAYDDIPVSDESIPENGLESLDEYLSSNVPTDEVVDKSVAELEKSFSGTSAPFPKETAS